MCEPKYESWIKHHAKNPYGQCAEVSAEMAIAFPELTAVWGWYHCPIWGERSHWWCITSDGEIVDPTAAQFPSKGVFEYILGDNNNKPTGLCPNCSGYIYDGGSVCGDKCHREYAAYCSGQIFG